MAEKTCSDEKPESDTFSEDALAKDLVIARLQNRIADLENKLKLHSVDTPAGAVTRRQPIEEALYISEERLDFLLNSANIGAWDLNLIDHTAWRSLCHDQIFGYAEQLPEWTYELFLSHVLPEDREYVDGSFKKAIATHADWDFHCRIRRTDGQVRWMWAHGRIRYNEQGQPVRMLGINVDITERKRMETELRRSRDELELWVKERTAELQRSNEELIREIEIRKRTEESLLESEERLRMMIDTSPVPMVIFAENTITFINKMFTKTFGYTIEDIPTVDDWWPLAYPDEEYRNFVVRRWDAAIEPAIRNRTSTEPREVVVRCKDGSDKHILSYFSSIGDLNLSVFYDITARIKAEEALRDAKQQAELYVDLMGHDINNMNHSAMGYLELALEQLEMDKKLRVEDKLLLEKPLQAVKNSSLLIDNVRKLQLLMTEGIKTRPVDLRELLAEIDVDSFKRDDREVRVYIQDIPHYLVEANELLKDAFSNLISNAIKHSDKELPLTIAVKVEPVNEADGLYYKCTVDDNGPGVPDNLKKKLFHRFQRGATKAHGKGLGLYLVRTIVEGYHGKVWVEDRVPGDHTQGARFIIMLPAIQNSLLSDCR